MQAAPFASAFFRSLKKLDAVLQIELSEFNRLLPVLSAHSEGDSSPRASGASSRTHFPLLLFTDPKNTAFDLKEPPRTDGKLSRPAMTPEAIAARETREYQNLKVMAGEIDHACRVAGVGSTAHSAEEEYPPRNWSGESNRSVFLDLIGLSGIAQCR